MSIFLLHLMLATILFFLTNWIGKHSIQIGYMQLSFEARTNEAPAFNVIYRAFSPIAFIVILSAIFYRISLDIYIHNIYLVVIYYFLFRVAFNVAVGRTILMNWTEFMLIAVLSVLSSYLIYKNIILEKSFLFPSGEEVGSATWLAIAAFLYKTVNSIEPSAKAELKRRNRYVREQFDKYKRLYGKIIDDVAKTKNHRNLVLSIMIYEGFNRPALYRALENIAFPLFKKKATIGPMQVTTEKTITDEQSIRLGASKIISAYERELKSCEDPENNWELSRVRSSAFMDYNNSSSYANEVDDIYITLDAYGDA